MPSYHYAWRIFYKRLVTIQFILKIYPSKTQRQTRKLTPFQSNKVGLLLQKIQIFFSSFLIRQEPYKLLQITTGNITNAELEALFLNNLPQLAELFEQHALIEMSRNAIIVHQ